MTKRKQELSKLTPLPILPTEAIYIGVDIGKFKQVAGFVSKTLLERHKHFENCPAFTFEQSREGFRALVERIRASGPASALLPSPRANRTLSSPSSAIPLRM